MGTNSLLLASCSVSVSRKQAGRPSKRNLEKQHDRVTQSCEPIYLLKLAPARGSTQAPSRPGHPRLWNFRPANPPSNPEGWDIVNTAGSVMVRNPPLCVSLARACASFPPYLEFRHAISLACSPPQLRPILVRPSPGPDATLQWDAHALAEPGPASHGRRPRPNPVIVSALCGEPTHHLWLGFTTFSHTHTLSTGLPDEIHHTKYFSS